MAFTSSAKPKSDAPKLKGFRDGAFASLGSLIKLLPTGTVFTFQFLKPLLTNNGHSCASRALSLASSTAAPAPTAWSVAASPCLKGCGPRRLLNWSTCPSTSSGLALLSTIVFAVTALLDPNTVECLYSSSYKKDHKVLLKAVPVVIGAISSAGFAGFPSKRHGIGRPFSSDESDDRSASKEVE
ncbi:protein DMP2 [Eucalyptus grandis]|uniref:protein DMP2 n=1 Tax=Eucalyptus grandis TaxID=71139 RepID=UPI00192F1009|nr:protein DMP2 [Eucalyptus grandis]